MAVGKPFVSGRQGAYYVSWSLWQMTILGYRLNIASSGWGRKLWPDTHLKKRRVWLQTRHLATLTDVISSWSLW